MKMITVHTKSGHNFSKVNAIEEAADFINNKKEFLELGECIGWIGHVIIPRDNIDFIVWEQA